MSKIRVYPTSCTSAFCGRIECPADCRHLPKLKAFKAWRDENAAKPVDEIWSPLVYKAD